MRKFVTVSNAQKCVGRCLFYFHPRKKSFRKICRSDSNFSIRTECVGSKGCNASLAQAFKVLIFGVLPKFQYSFNSQLMFSKNALYYV